MTKLKNISLNININLNFVDEKKYIEILNFLENCEANGFIHFSDLDKYFYLKNRKYFTVNRRFGELNEDQPIDNIEIDIKG